MIIPNPAYHQPGLLELPAENFRTDCFIPMKCCCEFSRDQTTGETKWLWKCALHRVHLRREVDAATSLATANLAHADEKIAELQEQLKVDDSWKRTCIHHTDAERAIAAKLCPVCHLNESLRGINDVSGMVVERFNPAIFHDGIQNNPIMQADVAGNYVPYGCYDALQRKLHHLKAELDVAQEDAADAFSYARDIE